MSKSPINLHRSMAGFLVGNVLAIFVSSIVCLFAWQATHPEFFKELHQYLQARKELKKDENAKDNGEKNERGNNEARKNEGHVNDKKVEPNKEAAEKDRLEKDSPEKGAPEKDEIVEPKGKDQKIEPTKPEFPITVLVLTLVIDASFCVLAGFVCVKIAGFARNHHGMLMALFVFVWKVQQLVGFVENQLPASLMGIEIIALPIACIFGAAMAGENDTEIDEDVEM